MRSSTHALRLRQRGRRVAILQQQLTALGYTIKSSELEKSYYGTTTRDAVAAFQQDRQLHTTGEAGPETERAIKTALAREDQPGRWEIYGLLKDAAGQPLKGAEMAVFQLETDKGLATATTGTNGDYRLVFSASAFSPPLSHVSLYFTVSMAGTVLLSTKGSPLERLAPGRYEENLSLPEAERRMQYLVRGYVYSSHRRALPGMKIRLFDVSMGRAEENLKENLLSKGETNERGHYELAYSWDTDAKEGGPDLKVQVLSSSGNVLGVSPIHYNAGPVAAIYVVLDAECLDEDSEYKQLTDRMGCFAGQKLAQAAPGVPSRFSHLRECEGKREVSYLANKTGWDARLVAMAALADSYSERTGVRPELFYAFFRAGIPANDEALFRLKEEAVLENWKGAIERNIIPAELEEELNRELKKFQNARADFWVGEKAPPFGLSRSKELLNLVLDTDLDIKTYSRLFFEQGGDAKAFWEALPDSALKGKAEQLRRLSQWAQLTGSNAELIGKLGQTSKGLREVKSLVAKGLYELSAWKDYVKVKDLDPEFLAHFPGESANEQLENYARYMASQLKLAYPTAVMAQRIRTNKIQLEHHTAIANLLERAPDDFDLKRHPINRLFNGAGGNGFSKKALSGLQRLQRACRLSPAEDQVGILMQEGLDSARGILRYNERRFIEKFKEKLGGDAAARHLYVRARSTYNTAMNLATSYLQQKAAPELYPHPATGSNGRHNGSQHARGLTEEENTPQATLENLFGSMDFPSCTHCQSMLSPAAYFVELLEFLDNDEEENKKNPVNILLERRPDLEYLELSCENTETVLPYVDLVNEILEHHVVYASLDAFKGHNMDGETDTEDLLANPQHVEQAAYNLLKTYVYPLSLPFNRHLEELRLYFDAMGVSLREVLERFPPENSKTIVQEVLGLSPEEYNLLVGVNTSSCLQLYGEETGSLNDKLEAGGHFTRALTRKLGITYEELLEIIKTRFLNPHSHLLSELETYRMYLEDILDFIKGEMAEEDFRPMLEEALGADATDDEIEIGDKIGFLYGHKDEIKKLIVLVSPDGEQVSFDRLVLRHADGTPLSETDFIKLYRFVRLWKKLGWSIEEVDKAITAFRSLAPDDTEHWAEKLLLYLAGVKRIMKELGLREKDLLSILALRAPIDTFGSNSLYRELFLNPSVRELDEAFSYYPGPIPDGEDGTLRGHTAALLAAFNLKADELDRIIGDIAGFADSLSLGNLTLIHRYAFLARSLKISVRELIFLKGLTGINPITGPDNERAPILTFFRQVQKIKDAGFKASQLAYLLRQEDWSGEAAPKEEDVLGLARTIRAEFGRIEQEHQVKEDPEGELTKAQLAQLYDDAVAESFMSLLGAEPSLTVDYSSDPSSQLELVMDEDDPVSDQFYYFPDTNPDPEINEPKLAFKGIMTQAQYDKLRSIIDSKAFSSAIQFFYDKVYGVEGVIEQYELLFAEYPKLKTLFEGLIGTYESRLAQVREYIAPILLPKLKLIQLNQTLSSQTGLASELVKLLLETPGLLLDDNKAADHFFRLGEEVEAVAAGSYYLEVPQNGEYHFYVEPEQTLSLDGEQIEPKETEEPEELVIFLEAGRLYKFELEGDGTTPVAWQSLGIPKGSIPPAQLYPYEAIQDYRSAYLRLLKAAAIAEQLQLLPEELLYFCWEEENEASWLQDIPTGIVPIDNWTNAQTLFEKLKVLMDYTLAREALDLEGDIFLKIMENPEVEDESGEQLLTLKTGWEDGAIEALRNAFKIEKEDEEPLPPPERPAVFWPLMEQYALAHELGIARETVEACSTNEPTEDIVTTLKGALRAKYDERGWRKKIQPVNDELRNRSRDALVARTLHQLYLSGAGHIDTADKLFEYLLIDVEMDACMKTSRLKQAISSAQLFTTRCFMNLEPEAEMSNLRDKEHQWGWMKRYRVWEANRKVFLFPENWLEPELRDDKSHIFQEFESELLESDINEDSAVTALYHYLEKLDEVARLDVSATCYEEPEIVDEHTTPKDGVLHVIGKTPGSMNKFYYRRRQYGVWTPWEPIGMEVEGEPVLPVVWKGRLFLFWLNVITSSETKDSPELVDVQSEIIEEQRKKNVWQNKIDKISPCDEDDFICESAVANCTNAINVIDARLSNLQEQKQQLELKPKIMVKLSAALSWSEYYQGKWQMARNSDLSEPIFLHEFQVDTEDFHPEKLRRKLYLSSHIGTQGAVNILVHYDGRSLSRFKLYTKHGLPGQTAVKLIDKDEPLKPFHHRVFEPVRSRLAEGEWLSMVYYRGKWYYPFFGRLQYLFDLDDKFSRTGSTRGNRKPAYMGLFRDYLEQMSSHNLLFNAENSWVAFPRHDTGEPYEVPFFYQDRRHVFLVWPTLTWERAQDAGLVLVPGNLVLVSKDFPELWSRPALNLPDPLDIQFYDVLLGEAGLGSNFRKIIKSETPLIGQGPERILASNQLILFDGSAIGVQQSVEQAAFEENAGAILENTPFGGVL